MAAVQPTVMSLSRAQAILTSSVLTSLVSPLNASTVSYGGTPVGTYTSATVVNSGDLSAQPLGDYALRTLGLGF